MYVCGHDKTRLGLKVPYEDGMLNRVRQLPAAKWSGADGLWLVSNAPGALEEVMTFAEREGLELMPEVEDLVRFREQQESRTAQRAIMRAMKNAKRLGLSLYPDQPRGVAFLAQRQNALLAWETGTGKTIVALSALPRNAAVLVVCPAVMKYVWEAECLKWRPDLTPVVLNGKDSLRTPQPGELLITNYDVLPKVQRKGRADVCPMHIPEHTIHTIWDEFKKCKNNKAMRTRCARAIIREVTKAKGFVWGLEGTPMMTKPQELWSVLYGLRLAEIAFGSYREFQRAFNYKKARRWDNPWGKPKPWVRQRLNRVMDQQALDLPQPQIRFLEVDVTGSKAFFAEGERLHKEWRDAAGGLDEYEKWQRGSSWRKELAAKKTKAAMPLLRNLVSEDETPVVFSYHRDPVITLSEQQGWCRILGGESKREAKNRIDEFQAGMHKGIAISIRSGGEGITLTRSRTVVFIDLDYNPVMNQQAIARCRRRGQRRQVNVVIIVARNTCDYETLAVLEDRSKMIDAAMGKGKPVLPPKKKRPNAPVRPA